MSDFDICISVNVFLKKLPPACLGFNPSVVSFLFVTMERPLHKNQSIFRYITSPRFILQISTSDHNSIESDQLYSCGKAKASL